MEGKGVGETVTDFPVWTSVNTGSPPCHLALSSDDLTLSVCVTRAAGVFALMFDIRAFAKQVTDAVFFHNEHVTHLMLWFHNEHVTHLML